MIKSLYPASASRMINKLTRICTLYSVCVTETETLWSALIVVDEDEGT